MVINTRKEIQRILQPLLQNKNENIALLDFPNHSNVGDSAIWLGEYLFLQQSGFRNNVYMCDIDTYSKEDLAETIGSGTILLHGGGNLGDLWPRYQVFREQVIRDFPNNRIIQLPQSIFFLNKENMRRASSIFQQHSNLTILVRDKVSLEIAITELKVRAYLCPDMAFNIGQINMQLDATIPCIWLFRDDKEAGSGLSKISKSGVWQYDWHIDEHTKLMKSDAALRYLYSVEVAEQKKTAIRRKISSMYPHVAKERVMRACRVLARTHNVVTERLHGHIICMLMGIPHYILDTRYGKIGNYIDTWNYNSPLVHLCDSEAEALVRATSS